jgi:signal transduction histidine kinase
MKRVYRVVGPPRRRRDSSIARSALASSHLTFLAEASVALAESLDYHTTLQRVTHLLVPRLADIAVIDLLDDSHTLRRVAVTHVQPEKVHLLYEIYQRYPPINNEHHPIWRTLQSGQTLHIPTISQELMERSALDADHLRLIKATGPHTASLLIPLVARSRSLGIISLGLVAKAAPFTPDVVEVATELARRIALAIDNAHLFARAEQAVRVRDHFITIAAHELKNPLTTVIMHAHLLQRRLTQAYDLPEREQRALRAIVEQTTKLNRMMTDLLDATRLETGQLQLERSHFDLCELTHEVIADLQPTLRLHAIICENTEAVMLEGDKVRLAQVLHNLLNNAIKYSPDGGVITVEVTQDQQAASILVTDEGVGIPADKIGKIFDHLYRVNDATSQRVKGFGIGLYVVREIVRLHGGHVEVTSQEGHGSTFRVVLPLPATAEGLTDERK